MATTGAVTNKNMSFGYVLLHNKADLSFWSLGKLSDNHRNCNGNFIVLSYLTQKQISKSMLIRRFLMENPHQK